MKTINFNKYSGFRIRGKEPIGGVFSSSHLAFASRITSMVESGGRYGTVISYDGTGMTAGIHQAIAVYPKYLYKGANSQGPLWKLLTRIMALNPSLLALVNVQECLFEGGMTLASDGIVRHLGSGNAVSGEDIRSELGTPGGRVPDLSIKRARAVRYIHLFHDIFSDKRTFEIQQLFGESHFIKSAERHKMRFCAERRDQLKTIQSAIYGSLTGINIALLNIIDLSTELNLAMCFFWSYYVNAPSMAMKKLCQVYDTFDKRDSTWGERFPAALVKKLGTCSYGRWDDDIDTGRYQRTRKEMQKCWGEELFKGSEAIMPKDFK